MLDNVLLGKILFALFFTILGATSALRSTDRDGSFFSFAIKVSFVFISVRVGLFLSILKAKPAAKRLLEPISKSSEEDN